MPYRQTLRKDLNRNNLDGILNLFKIFVWELLLYPFFLYRRRLIYSLTYYINYVYISEEWRWRRESQVTRLNRRRRLCCSVTRCDRLVLLNDLSFSHRNEIKIKYKKKGQFTRTRRFEIAAARRLSAVDFFFFSF